MDALSSFVLVSLTLVVLCMPRRWALLGMAAGVLYLTEYAAVDVAGFNMFAIRFLELAGFARVMARREFRFSSLNDLDRIFIFFYCYLTIVYLLRANGGFAYAIGVAVDAGLCYFTFRGLVSDVDDLRWFLRAFVFLLAPYVLLLFVEMLTRHSPFWVIVGNAKADWLRKGRPRCVGSFREPSLLGSLGASFLPLYIGLYFSKSDRLYSIFGILLSIAIVGFSNSGGPLGFTCFVLLGWLVWPWRTKMRLVRRIILIFTIGLALVMKAPIWYLPTHFTFGGDAWHRSYLIDISMRHLREWWLWGMPVSKTAHWFAYTLGTMDQADITNQYLSYGFGAGLMAVVLFVWLLVRAFQNLGRQMELVRYNAYFTPESEYLLWGLGAMLIGHIANFISITYFDQFYVIWFMQLAFISSLTQAPAYAPAQATELRLLRFTRWSVARFRL